MMNWWRFPPLTTEVQLDEKWAFVAKKEANCDRSDPADDHKGDSWDHIAFDPEHRLVVVVVPGPATSKAPRRWWASSAVGLGAGP